MVGVTYQEIHLFVEFLKEQYGQGRPDYIEALNDLDGLVEVSYREAIERFLEDNVTLLIIFLFLSCCTFPD
ncbi:TPA: hypothetical protein VZ907_001764 [Streptococcus pneumoniae]|nr:hypothetical protein [Streptococcus pneumoniae]